MIYALFISKRMRKESALGFERRRLVRLGDICHSIHLRSLSLEMVLGVEVERAKREVYDASSFRLGEDKRAHQTS